MTDLSQFLGKKFKVKLFKHLHVVVTHDNLLFNYETCFRFYYYNIECLNTIFFFILQSEQACQGNCYDSTIILTSFCISKPKCIRRQYFRCYNQQTCTGLWRAIELLDQCSATCGGGTKRLIATCVNEGK